LLAFMYISGRINLITLQIICGKDLKQL